MNKGNILLLLILALIVGSVTLLYADSGSTLILPRGGESDNLLVKSGDSQEPNDLHFRWHSYGSQPAIIGTDENSLIKIYPYSYFAENKHKHYVAEIPEVLDYKFDKAIFVDSAISVDEADEALVILKVDEVGYAKHAISTEKATIANNGLYTKADIGTTPIVLNDTWGYKKLVIPIGGTKDQVLTTISENSGWVTDTSISSNIPINSILGYNSKGVLEYLVNKGDIEASINFIPIWLQVIAVFFEILALAYTLLLGTIMFCIYIIGGKPSPKPKKV